MLDLAPHRAVLLRPKRAVGLAQVSIYLRAALETVVASGARGRRVVAEMLEQLTRVR
jgi:hypothetical protein